MKKRTKKYKNKQYSKHSKVIPITLFILILFIFYAFAPSPLIYVDSFIQQTQPIIDSKYKLIYLTIFIVTVSIVIKILKTFKRNVGAGKRLTKIDLMTGEDFEKYLMYNFQKRGYRVKTTPVTGDYGADLILTKRGTKICVQAKRYKSNVGNSAIQEIVAAMPYYKCDYGMVITNSYFTAAAKTLAKVNNIELWDRNRIIKEFNIKK